MDNHEDAINLALDGENNALLLLQQSIEGLRRDVQEGSRVAAEGAKATADAVNNATVSVQSLHRQALGIVGGFTLLLLLALMSVVGVQTSAKWGDAAIEARPVVYIEQAPATTSADDGAQVEVYYSE